MNEKPLVSIVMPSFNQCDFIEASVASVMGQDYPSLELVVQDGGSTDGTIDTLIRIASEDPRIRWSSASDNGPAQAINRALARARGTYLGWLNSDDLYTDGAISRAMDALEARPDWLLAYGHGQHIDESGRILDDYPTHRPTVPFAFFQHGCFICQPTMFFRRTAYVMLGGLNEDLKTAFDYEYWLRAFTAFRSRIGFVDAVQAQSRLHQDCITMRSRATVGKEAKMLHCKYGLGCPPVRE